MTLRSEIVALARTVLPSSSVFADEAPEEAALPQIEIHAPGDQTAEISGDGGVLRWREDAEVLLREYQSQSDGTLKNQLVTALNGAPLQVGTRLRVSQVTRLPDNVHDTVLWTIALHTFTRG